MEDNSKDESINFGDVKEKVISFFKTGGDFAKVTTYCKKNSAWLIPLIFIIIAISFSTSVRMMPSDLPITDSWAQDSVYNSLQNQVENQINQQYPNLPQQNKQRLIETEFQKVLQENNAQIEQNIAQVSQQFKTNFQDENGDTYLLAIDPYLWYSQARNVVNYGHLGDKKIDGQSYYSLRDGRLDKKSSVQLHPYIGAYLYKFLSIFNKDISLMKAIFLLPPILIGLAILPAFFIGRKFGGNVGGFFAAMFLALNASLLTRTPAGFSDTDPYNILLPLLVLWFFLEAYDSKSIKYRYAYIGLSGLVVGIYAATWSGWSPIFLFVLAALILAVIWQIIKKSYTAKKFALPSTNYFVGEAKTFGLFLVSSGIFVTLFRGFAVFWSGFTRPIKFITLKQVGIKSIWPNVLTTVAEFNQTSFDHTIGQLGGTMIFYIAILGLIFLLYRGWKTQKQVYFFVIILWFIGTLYSTTKGARFSLLVVPPFALLLGASFGEIFQLAVKWAKKGININKKVGQVLVFGVLILFLITPFSTAQSIGRNEVPSMNDQWYDALTKIKNDGTDAIITSWWDFGHWFQSISERRVTFDGGDQGQRIHWVGRSLQTDNEAESVGILRMLNCVQETAPAKLDEYTGDSLKSVQILKEVILLSSKTAAKNKFVQNGLTAEQAAVMVEYTHCDNLIPNYFITSEDMIGKAGVWGHFGTWDFEKASMYQNTVKLSRKEGVAYLVSNFGLSEKEADTLHNEIQNANADQWIAPWPGYLSGKQGCTPQAGNKLACPASIQGGQFIMIVDLNTMDVTIQGNDKLKPNSIVYPSNAEILEKKFEGELTGFSILLLPNGNSFDTMISHSAQASSVFTKLFFFDGHGMKCFDKFDEKRQVTGQKIITWKVDYTCASGNNVFSVNK